LVVSGVSFYCSGAVEVAKYSLVVVFAVSAAAVVGAVARCSWLKVGLCVEAEAVVGFAGTA